MKKYWGYNNESWFDYRKELFIENNFSTSLASSFFTTTHIHRPLEQYLTKLIEAGFEIIKVVEPSPYKPIPEGYTYNYPRFLVIKCSKNSSEEGAAQK